MQMMGSNSSTWEKTQAESQDRWQQEPEVARQLKAALGQLQAEVPPPITPRKSR